MSSDPKIQRVRLRAKFFGTTCQRRRVTLAAMVLALLLLGAIGAPCVPPGQTAQHAGAELQGYVTGITPTSITVFDTKRQVKFLTDKDYSALVEMGAAVTVQYTTEGRALHLKDISSIAPVQTFVAPEMIRQYVKRIVILAEADDVANTQGLIDAISQYLAENAGWFVAPSALAQEVANRHNRYHSSLDAINSDTGTVDMQGYLEGQSSLVESVARETRSDAVLEVRIVKVKADVRSSIASWDDMREPIASRKVRVLSPFEGLMGKGWVYAATADMSLRSPTGTLLWKRRRGFAVLGVQSAAGSKFRERPLTEVYQNSGAMQRWLVSTLGDLAPPRAAETAQTPSELTKESGNGRPAGEVK